MTISMVSCKKTVMCNKTTSSLKKPVSVWHCLQPAVTETKSKTGNEFGSNRVPEARAITHLFQVIIVS